jgi:hypothetical protein
MDKGNEVELRLHPLPPSCTLEPTALHDQGYGSERSPEEERPPSLPGLPDLTSKYPFITRGRKILTDARSSVGSRTRTINNTRLSS